MHTSKVAIIHVCGEVPLYSISIIILVMLVTSFPLHRRAELEARRLQEEEERKRVEEETRLRREQEEADRQLAVSLSTQQSYIKNLNSYLYVYMHSILRKPFLKSNRVEPSFSCYNLTILQPIKKILVPLFLSLNTPSDDTFTVR